MVIYKISYTGVGARGYAWSLGFWPLKTGMPFLHPVVRQRKDAFWEVNYRTFSGLLIDSTGSVWPDVLGSGGPPPSYFLSERIVGAFKRSGVPTSRITEMPIGRIKSKRLSKIEPPRYFVVEAYPGIAVAWDEMNVPTDGHGNPNLQPLPKPWPPPGWKVRASSWSGSDLFTWKNFKSGDATDLLCTERVKQIAEAEGWTNVCFTPLEIV